MKESLKPLDCLFQMDVPNESLNLKAGNFELINGDYKIEMEGMIQYLWLPDTRLVLTGKMLSGNSLLNIMEMSSKSLIVNYMGQKICNGYIRSVNTGGNNSIAVQLLKSVVIPEFKKCTDIYFHLPNYHLVYGGARLERKDKYALCRLSLNWDDFLVEIDPVEGFSDKNEMLGEIGGYFISHSGKISRIGNSKSITHKQIESLSTGLSFFLSFFKGTKTSAIFLSGHRGKARLWEDYSSKKIQRYKAGIRCIENADKHEIYLRYWPKFMGLWQDTKDREILADIIHWYLEAKSNSEYTNNSIVLAQISMEILFDWIVKGKMKALDSNAKLNAANQFRLLLSMMGVSREIPEEFETIRNYVLSKQRIVDGVDLIVDVRNNEVHPSNKHEYKESIFLYECKLLSLYYIERVVLSFLDRQEN